MKIIKILINKSKRVLGYCDFGELENSIEIEVEDNFEFDKNLNDYIYTDGALKYSPELDKEKFLKREQLKYIRDKKIYENLEVKGSIFQVRKQDLEKFFLKKIEADFNPELKEQKEKWILADNSFKDIDFNDIQDIFKAFGERQRKIFGQFGKLSVQLQQAQTWEEIENIKWE